jgi:hypothetical protein
MHCFVSLSCFVLEGVKTCGHIKGFPSREVLSMLYVFPDAVLLSDVRI